MDNCRFIAEFKVPASWEPTDSESEESDEVNELQEEEEEDVEDVPLALTPKNARRNEQGMLQMKVCHKRCGVSVLSIHSAAAGRGCDI